MSDHSIIIMNPRIEELYKIASKEQRHIIGLMSGTSLDGLDVAYCGISGFGKDTKVNVLAFETITYTDDVKNKIRKVFAKETVDFPYLSMLNEWIGMLHAGMVNDFLVKNQIERTDVDIIASHGQTVMHVPKHQHNNGDFPNATLQIGDGDHLAVHTGIITLSDFRQKHLAAGGEGAPLAVYADYLVFSKHGEDRIMLNIGGIANCTFLPGDGDVSRVFVTDTGPGNTLMDACMKHFFHQAYDMNGEKASQGKVDNGLLKILKDQDFFKLDFPKTTGPEVFNIEFVLESIKKNGAESISSEDILATLNRLSAETIAEAILAAVGHGNWHIYISGGGVYNQALVRNLHSLLPHCDLKRCDDLGISGDAKEAVLFAVLANETLAGHPLDFGHKQKVPGVCMGKISLPE